MSGLGQHPSKKEQLVNTIRKRLPSPAMLIACVALMVSLGGVSYAAGVLPKNSVGTAQLKKSAITGAKVKNRSLMAADFKAGQLPAGPHGPAGLPGPKGDKGDTGAAGAAGISGLEIVVRAPETVPAGQHGYGEAYCPTGKKPIGGGGGTTDGGLAISHTGPNANGWFVDAENTAGVAVDLRVYAVCAKVG
jgi:hypothetical protein